MKIKANIQTRILPKDIMREEGYITLLTDATVYLMKTRRPEPEDFLDNGFPLRIYGVHETRGYKGELWVLSDTENTDIRVIEY